MRTRLGTRVCYCGTAAQHEALHTGSLLRGSSFVLACWHQHCWHSWPAGIDLHDTVGIAVNNTVRVLALMLLLPLAPIPFMGLASIFLSWSTQKCFSRNKIFLPEKKKWNKIVLDPKYSRFYGDSSLNWICVWIGIKIRAALWLSKSITLCLCSFQPLGIVAREDGMAAKLPKQNLGPQASTVHAFTWIWLWPAHVRILK